MEYRKKKMEQESRPKRRALSVLNEDLVKTRPRPCAVNSIRLSKENGVRERNPSFTREKGACERNPSFTRKSGAQMSIVDQHCAQDELKKHKPSPSARRNEFAELVFHDMETNEDPPLSLTCEECEQVSEMDRDPQSVEVDMDDCVEKSILDKDKRDDAGNLDYADDLFDHYRRMEMCSSVSPNYMERQGDINDKMRAILIDWLVEVQEKFELMKETLFLTVSIIDRFLSEQTTMRKKLQLVGLVAMLLACKYEEVAVPMVDDLVLISDNAYTRSEVLEMERLVLNKLKFNLSFPTPYVFMQRFLSAAQSDNKLEMLSFYLIELSLVEYEMLKFPPSLLAASAVYAARSTVHGFQQWIRTSECCGHYSEHQLLECARLMVGFHARVGTGKLTAVHRKYSTSKYDYISSSCVPDSFPFMV